MPAELFYMRKKPVSPSETGFMAWLNMLFDSMEKPVQHRNICINIINGLYWNEPYGLFRIKESDFRGLNCHFSRNKNETDR